MYKIVSLLAALALWASTVDSAKILVYVCQLSRSHHIVYHPIIRELALRGHEVDYYTHHLLPNPPKNLKQIQFPWEDYQNFLKLVENVDGIQSMFPHLYNTKSLRQYSLREMCYNTKTTQELLASKKKYDLVMGEFVQMQDTMTVLLHKFNASGVSLLSLPDNSWINEVSGMPNNPSYMVPFGTSQTDEMTFFGRLMNFVDTEISTMVDYYYMLGPIQWHADRHLTYEGWESRPSVLSLSSEIALILVSAHHSLGYSYPTAPHVKNVLGTNVDETPSPLPKDLQEYMDGAKYGVIYFSLGSLVSIKTLQRHNGFEPLLKVLSTRKEKVLWKWTSASGEEFPNVSNIKFSKWLPQQSVLAHDKVKLFITHGGMGSLTEGVYHKVPLIALPVLGDQVRNVKLLVKLGLGLEMSLTNLTESSISWAINEVINNVRYKEQAIKRSAMFRDRPMKPVDEAVYWIEYVLRHGNVLQSAAVRMPFYQLYLLDVIGFLTTCVLIVIFVIKRLLKTLRRWVMGTTLNVDVRETKKRK